MASEQSLGLGEMRGFGQKTIALAQQAVAQKPQNQGAPTNPCAVPARPIAKQSQAGPCAFEIFQKPTVWSVSLGHIHAQMPGHGEDILVATAAHIHANQVVFRQVGAILITWASA